MVTHLQHFVGPVLLVQVVTVLLIRQCQVNGDGQQMQEENVHGNQTYSLNVDILHKPVIHPLYNMMIIEGNSPSTPVVCQVISGNPRQTDIKWIRGNLQISSQNGATSLRLPLYNVQRSEGGTYNCTAENTMDPTEGQTEVGIDHKQFQLTVFYDTSIIQFEEIDHPGVSEVTIEEGDTIQLQCFVDSKPGSTIYINKGHVIKSNGTLTNKMIYTVQNATFMDTGIYTCVGFNERTGQVSRPSRNLQLNVKYKPSPPINISCDTVRVASAVIYWTPGFDGGFVQTFLILYRKESEQQWSREAVVDTNENKMHVTLENLESGSRYIVRIYATNKLGNSTAQSELYFATAALVPESSKTHAAVIGGAVAGFLVVTFVSVLIVLGIRRYLFFKEIENEPVGTKENEHREYDYLDFVTASPATYSSPLSIARENVYENLKLQVFTTEPSH